MTTCSGCNCPIDTALDIVLRESVMLLNGRVIYRDYCSATCIVDFHEAAAQGRASLAFSSTVTPENWRAYR